jgi:thiamine-phosphate pyrophosphorylase
MKENFGLYLITSHPVAGYEAVARAAVECGLRYLQLRMKDASVDDVIRVAEKLKNITRDSATCLIINDDLAVAMAVDADGIHLGQGDLALSEARHRWNAPGKIFGLSTHTMEQALQAVDAAPDYIGIGPVFPTQTKQDTAPVLGVSATARIAGRIPLTAVAIGGINAENLPRLMRAGVENFCVVCGVDADPDPHAAIRRLQKIRENCTF